jgi:hypothetical protein
MNTTLIPPTEIQIATMRQAVLTAIPQRGRRRRRRLMLASAAAVLVAGSTTAGAIAYQTSIEALNTSFDCYTTANINGPHGTSQYPGNAQDTTALNSLPDRVQFALQTCEAGYVAIPTEKSPGTGPFTVPNPTACLLDNGRIAVLPNKNAASNETFCKSAGLQAPAS